MTKRLTMILKNLYGWECEKFIKINISEMALE